MNLFYTPPEQVREHTLTITGDEAHHATRVLRYRIGDTLWVVDGVGNRVTGKIVSVGNKTLEAEIKQRDFDPRTRDLILVLGLIKNRQRLEYAIEKAVELGATGVVLFKSDNSERGKVNIDRLQAIALSAMTQSLRSWLPVIQYKETLIDIIKEFPKYRMIVAHEKVNSNTPTHFNSDQDYLLLIGPEGGFSDQEIGSLKESKAEIISLGRYRLRSETAVAALLSLFL